MRELALHVPAGSVEEALDALLPIAPHGVIEVPRGDEVELRVRGEADRDAVLAAWDAPIREREVPDDWHARRLADYAPIVIADRLVVRPDWAPPPAAGLLDVVIADDSAFGVGTHPTTRMCLGALCALEPSGSALDLGCGSGVLAIAAALLGWEPVVAVDRAPEAIAATRANAARSGAPVDARAGDVSELAGMAADIVLANVPLPVHAAVAEALAAPRVMIASGVQEPDADACARAYGLDERARAVSGGWAALTLSPRP